MFGCLTLHLAPGLLPAQSYTRPPCNLPRNLPPVYPVPHQALLKQEGTALWAQLDLEDSGSGTRSRSGSNGGSGSGSGLDVGMLLTYVSTCSHKLLAARPEGLVLGQVRRNGNGGGGRGR